jgi:hypothetical protein
MRAELLLLSRRLLMFVFFHSRQGMNDPATISKLSSLRRREAAPFNKPRHATPTSRLVGHVTRNMNINPRLDARPR